MAAMRVAATASLLRVLLYPATRPDDPFPFFLLLAAAHTHTHTAGVPSVPCPCAAAAAQREEIDGVAIYLSAWATPAHRRTASQPPTRPSNVYATGCHRRTRFDGWPCHTIGTAKSALVQKERGRKRTDNTALHKSLCRAGTCALCIEGRGRVQPKQPL